MATALSYDSLLTFIEVPAFTRMLPDYMKMMPTPHCNGL